MVRLIADRYGSTISSLLNFNSTMVRLRAKRTNIKRRLKKFQFHYGTIESNCSRASFLNIYHFNSTMVRLRAAALCSSCCRVAYFNSTMVRLRVLREFTGRRDIRFQFHYGTIERRSRVSQKNDELSFQFHYGTIERLTTK